MSQPIYVTKPDLPPLEEFLPYLREIWDSKRLTNGGQFHQQLEAALCEYLGVHHLSLCSNGTLGLVTALQALGISGEVITTPYSFVATAHSLLWNGIRPVFVDIEPETLNLDPHRIEAAVTEHTSAILAVHCYGNRCDVEAIQTIADKYKLKVIYDAAHAFGVRDAGGSVLRHGNLSVLSFHATKVFHTFEGGAIVCPDASTKQHIDHLKNFGFVDETTVVEAGINGKMSEINAAFGLLQLKHVDTVLNKRRQVEFAYRAALRDVPGISCLPVRDEFTANSSYFPVLVGPEYPLTRDGLYEKLRFHDILARRYFYPLIANFPMYREMPSSTQENLLQANLAANKVLCLPIYSELSLPDVARIAKIVCCR
ncbi:MAG: DegT/DnrJ/EryC1/StrS family aminotransferase [Alcaligenaceae bacterium]|nr:MAG: DegT/DnrJ/EryC1/StrS family aminotransferase [Alcaligenaceae bacterium]